MSSKFSKGHNKHGDDGQVFLDYFKNTPIHALTLNIHSDKDQLEEMWDILNCFEDEIEYHDANIQKRSWLVNLNIKNYNGHTPGQLLMDRL